MQTKDEEGTKAGSQIRRHLPGDGPLLGGVAPALFDGSADPARLEACLASPGALFFVALDDGRDVALAAGMIHPHLDRPAVFSSTMSANDCLVALRHCQHANGRTLRRARSQRCRRRRLSAMPMLLDKQKHFEPVSRRECRALYMRGIWQQAIAFAVSWSGRFHAHTPGA